MMATVLHRISKQLIASANTVEYSTDDWIIEPDLSAVVGYPSMYWLITDDVVSLMSQAERDAVDAANAAARKDATAAVMDQINSYERAFALILLDELNMHADRTNAILAAIDNATSLADVKTAVALIDDVPQRTISQLKTALLAKLGT